MKLRLPHLSLFLAIAIASAMLHPLASSAADRASNPWPQVLPPLPKSALSAEQEAELEKELAAAKEAFQSVKNHPRAADADIFLKALRYALDFNEWYDKTPEDSLKKAHKLLAEANTRIASLKNGETPWIGKPGRTVLGFYSHLDDSPQPYGIEIPEGLEFGPDKAKVPVWIWLHGRGDTATDLHFVASQLNNKPGEFKTSKAIIIHPFGRYCNGYKSAGEIDVLEATKDTLQRFNGDANRVALMGFSMGGAGAWHMGAHYADQWAAVHTGAGFVDVKRYQKLTPDKMPPDYERTLWGEYDVPDYARNFFNVPGLISYSGEKDKQRDSAEYMTEVLAKEDFELKHLIGPGMEHKYEPKVRDEIGVLIEGIVAQGRDPLPRKVWLQSRSARYSRMHWLHVTEVVKPWEDTRIEAEVQEADEREVLQLKTKNVRSFAMRPPWKKASEDRRIVLDNQIIDFTERQLYAEGPRGYYFFSREESGEWGLSADDGYASLARKAGGTCIDDAFNSRFVIVLPDKPGRNPTTDAWVKAESEHFIQRWRKLMRGDPIVVKASDVGDDLADRENLILWGDDQSNICIAKRLESLPLKWQGDQVKLAGKSFPAATHVPVLLYPEVASSKSHPLIVINSGLTFREGHDKTNSLQNPKLPDWAILNIETPPNADRVGEVKAAGFFDSRWQVTE